MACADVSAIHDKRLKLDGFRAEAIKSGGLVSLATHW
jgi:hypothetical protein